jgi:hypothetical protein
MSDPSKPESLKIEDARDLAEALVGVIDCVLALGIALAATGCVRREEIAAAMAEVLRQQQAGGEAATRQYAAKVLEQFFAAKGIGDPAPRFTVVTGGKPDDEPPAAA